MGLDWGNVVIFVYSYPYYNLPSDSVKISNPPTYSQIEDYL